MRREKSHIAYYRLSHVMCMKRQGKVRKGEKDRRKGKERKRAREERGRQGLKLNAAFMRSGIC